MSATPWDEAAQPLGTEPQAGELALELVAVPQPSPAASSFLPESLTQLEVGRPYHVEIWAQDRAAGSLGISGGFVDLLFAAATTEAGDVDHGRFGLLADGTVDGSQGRVDDVGGVSLDGQLGVAPHWTRLASVTMSAIAEGTARFWLEAGKMPFARVGQGNVSWEDVALDELSLPAQAPHPHPWQNAENPLDVNADGNVYPNDVLMLINFINRHGAGALPEPSADMKAPPYVDVNGDDQATAKDVLSLVNHLNSTAIRFAAPSPDAETHVPLSLVPMATFLSPDSDRTQPEEEPLVKEPAQETTASHARCRSQLDDCRKPLSRREAESTAPLLDLKLDALVDALARDPGRDQG